MPTLIKSISGIRGIVGDGLDPVNLVYFANAFAKYCDYGKIVVGRDARITGNYIDQIICGTLIASGCEVINIGICPTPTVQMYVEKLSAQGGIVITASHNPNEWNALKLLNKEGTFLFPDEAAKFLSLYEEIKPAFRKWNEIGKIEYINKSWEYHLEAIYKLEFLDINNLRKRNFKVLVDCVNGAGIEVVPKMLEDLGCLVTKINCEDNGIFPRLPEPIPSNLTETMKICAEGDFDLCIVVDPDVDRLVLITEKGEPFIEENTIVLATDFILSKYNGDVCVNLSTTRAVSDIAKKYNSNIYLTPVGEINVVKKMKETNAVIGGEGSGGVILPMLHYGRDALAGIAITLQYLLEKNKTLSEIKSELPNYYILKNKIELKNLDPDSLLNKLTEYYKDEKIITLDGLRVDFEKYWFHIRKSNTEPIIRFLLEANDFELAKNEMDNLTKLIYSLM